MGTEETPTDDRARVVGAAALLALGINGVVGVGIFFAPSELAALAGARGSVIVLAVVALALVPVAATFAALGRRFARDGGPVTFARAAFGERVAFGVGWLAYASALFSTSAVITGMSAALLQSAHVAGRWTTPLAVVVTLLLCGVSALGIDVSKRAWSAVTVAKLTPLVALAVLVLLRARNVGGEAAATAAATTAPDLGRALLTACFAFQGFEVVPVIGGEARAPERAMPIAIYGTLAVAALLYVILQWGFVTVATDLAAAAPLVHAAERLGGARWASLVAATTSVSAAGIAFGMVVTTPRYLSSAAETGRLAKLSRRGVPLAALGVTALALLVLVSLSSLAELFALASLAVVVQYAVVACALVALARRRAMSLGPRHLAPAVATLIVAAALLTAPSRTEWLAFLAVSLTGALAWRFVRAAA